jgi:hypothetical protein
MTMNATQRRTGSSAISALLLIFAAPGDADAVVHKLHVPGVTMSQARGSANCADWNWPSSEFGLVYQDCHQLYGRLDFVRGAKTLRKLTLVGRDFAQPQSIVVRLLRKRFDDPTATFTYPELVVEVTTTGSIDALRSVSVNVPAAKAQIDLGRYFYFLEATTDGPVEFVGVIVEYAN